MSVRKVILRVLLTLLVLMQVVRAQEVVPAPAETTASGDLETLKKSVADATLAPDQREEAARRLLTRGSVNATTILLDAIKDSGNPGGQLAVARALAGEANPNSEFINPLFPLLESPDHASAAALALAQFKGDAVVFSRLSIIASGIQKRELTRIAAIRAIGKLYEKRSADFLMSLVANPDESVTVRNSTCDTLVEMTGLKDNGRDMQKWVQWWQANKAKSETDWQLEVLRNRSARLDAIQKSHGDMVAALGRMLSQQTGDRQGDSLIQFLRNSEPELRIIGAKTIEDNLQNNKPIRADARQKLRDMVGDSNTSVRLAVASALRALNDAEALEVLLAQLAVERETEVQREIIRALAPIRSLKAGKPLVEKLSDDSLFVATAAADALKELGAIAREQDPVLAQQISLALERTLESRRQQAGSEALVISCVEAMVPLHDNRLLQLFNRLHNDQKQPPRVRKASLAAMGELGNADSADLIAASLEDPEPDVRLQAVHSLAKIGTFVHAEALWKHLRPADERDLRVREASWKLLETLFPTASTELLYRWAERFKKEPARQITVYKALAKRLLEDKQTEALAGVHQNIGEAMMHLDPPNATDAAVYFEQALTYWRSSSAGTMVTDGLVGQRMRALLVSRQYAQACTFGAQMLEWSATHNQTIGSNIRTEVERLRDAGRVDPNELKNALLLIDEAQKMKPPLADQYLETLKVIKEEIGPSVDRTPTTQP